MSRPADKDARAILWSTTPLVSVCGENQRPERRKPDADRVVVAMRGIGVGMDFAGIADPAAAILQGIRINALAIASGPRNLNTVVFPRHRGEVADHHSQLVRITSAADIGNDAFGRVR